MITIGGWSTPFNFPLRILYHSWDTEPCLLRRPEIAGFAVVNLEHPSQSLVTLIHSLATTGGLSLQMELQLFDFALTIAYLVVMDGIFS